MSKKISIIVPVYNVEKYLKRCIDSILKQTFNEFELILVNDGSTDRSGEICEEYERKDNRIKVINKKNGGLSSARNIGIKSAKGQYIGFVDSDDWIEKDMYESLYNACINNNAEISIIGVIDVDEKGVKSNEYRPKNITFNALLKKAYAWNKLFKKDLFIDNNLYFTDGRYYEDIGLIPKLIVKSKKTVSINKVTYNYFKRNNSITQSRDEKILDNLWAYTELKEYLEKENIYGLYKDEFEKGVKNFKKYYFNIIYDYPTKFILKNIKRIIKDFNKIGGITFKEYFNFIIRHLNISVRRILWNLKMRILKGGTYNEA